MVCSTRPGTRCGLSSRMLVFFAVLLVCTLLMVLIEHRATLEVLSRFSMRQYAPGSEVVQKCRQFTRKESINWDQLYYLQGLGEHKSLIWCKVPKAGSSSLIRTFVHHASGRQVANKTNVHPKMRQFYPRLSPEMMTAKLNTTIKFLVVRHPFERILSAYRDKLENYSSRDPPFRKYGERMVSRVVENGTTVEPTFSEFVTYLLETSPERYNEHWRTISRLCAPCSIHYDAIVKMENFHTEIKALLGQAGIYEDIGWAHSTGMNRHIVQSYFQQLAFTQIQGLYEIYRKDFLLFGYLPDMYFSIAVR